MNNVPLIFKDHSHDSFGGLNEHVFKYVRSWNAVIVNALNEIHTTIGDSDPYDSQLILWFILNGGYHFHYLIDVWGVDIVDFYSQSIEWKVKYEGIANVMSHIFMGCSLETYTKHITDTSEFFKTVRRTAPSHNYRSMFTQGMQRSPAWREFVISEKKKFKKFLSHLSAFLKNEMQVPNGFYLDGSRKKYFREREDVVDSMSQKHNNNGSRRYYPHKMFHKLSSKHVTKTIDAFHKNAALCHYLLKRSATKERCLAYVLFDAIPDPSKREKFALLFNVPENLNEELSNVTNLMFYARTVWHLSLAQMGMGDIHNLDFAPVVHPDVYIDTMVKNKQEMLDRVKITDPFVDAQRRDKIIKNYAFASTWELVTKQKTSADTHPICDLIDFGFNTKDFFNDPFKSRTVDFAPITKDFAHNYHTKVGNNVVGLSQYHLLTSENVTPKEGDPFKIMLAVLGSVNVGTLSTTVRRFYESARDREDVMEDVVMPDNTGSEEAIEQEANNAEGEGDKPQEEPPKSAPVSEESITAAKGSTQPIQMVEIEKDQGGESNSNNNNGNSTTNENNNNNNNTVAATTTEPTETVFEPMQVTEDDENVQKELAQKVAVNLEVPVVVLQVDGDLPPFLPIPKSVTSSKPNSIHADDYESSEDKYDNDAPVGDDEYDSQKSAPAIGSQTSNKPASLPPQLDLIDEVMEHEKKEEGEPQSSFEPSLDGFVVADGSQNSVNSRYGVKDNDEPQKPYHVFERALESWMTKITEAFKLKQILSKSELENVNSRQNNIMVAFTVNGGGFEAGYIRLEEMRLLTNIYRSVGRDAFRKLCFIDAVSEPVMRAALINKEPTVGTPVNTMRALLGSKFEEESEMYPRVVDHDDGPFVFDLKVNVCTYSDFKKVHERLLPTNPGMEEFLGELEKVSKETKQKLQDAEMKLKTKTTNIGIFKRMFAKVLGSKTENKGDNTGEQIDPMQQDAGNNNNNNNVIKVPNDKEKDDKEKGGSYVGGSFGQSFARLRQSIFMQLADSCAIPVTKIPTNRVVDDDTMLFLEKLAFMDQDDNIRNQIFNDANEKIEELKTNWDKIKLSCTYDCNMLLWCVSKIFSPLTHEDPYFKNAMQLSKELFTDKGLKVSDIKLDDKNVSLVYFVDIQDVDDVSRKVIDEKRFVVIKIMMIFDGMMFNTQEENIDTVPLPVLQNVEYLIKESIYSFATEPSPVPGETRGSRNIWQSCFDVAFGRRPYSDQEANENPRWFLNLWRSPTAGEVVYPGDDELFNLPKMYQLFYHQNCSGTVQVSWDALHRNADTFWLFMESLYFLGVRCSWFKFTQIFYAIIFDAMDGNGAWDMPYIGGNKHFHHSKTEAIVPGYYLWSMLRKANEHASKKKSSSVIKKLVESSIYTMLQHYHFMIKAGDKITFPVESKGAIDCESLKMVSPFTLDTFGDRPIEPSLFFDDDDEHIRKHWTESILKRRRLGTSIHGTSGGNSVINPVGTDQDYYFPLLSATIIPRK